MPQETLHQHHLADLASSGLSPDTIKASGCYSATEPTTRELLGFGVGPGLVFPYPGLSFVQVKPDKSVPNRKYVSPKGAGCRVYIPPNFPERAKGNLAATLYITEGVKKALKACQEGLACIAFSGVDAWKDRTNGKSAPIHDLDKFTWKGRTVHIVYDSDAENNPNVKQAEFRLAKELGARGASVFKVRLPSAQGGKKQGLDDYLVSHSVESFCAIEPVRVIHPAKENIKKSTSEATKPDRVSREGDDFTFEWQDPPALLTMTRLRPQPSGVEGEIAVMVSGRSLHWARINLSSLSARETLVTKLARTHPGHPWRDMLEKVCRETAEALRASSDTITLAPVRAMADRFLVEKLLVDHETNLIYADGGSGKSLLAMAIGIAVSSKTVLPMGLHPKKAGPVLYLDWESNQADHANRLFLLMAGLGLSYGTLPIHYRRMSGALADDMMTIRAEVGRLHPVLVVVDSLGAACGAEPESADSAIRAMNAARALNTSVLILAHVSKAQADNRGATRPFGSVYVLNLPRNAWELRRADEDSRDSLTVGCYHRKSNSGPLLSPFGLRFAFESDKIHLVSSEVSADAGLQERAGLSHGVRSCLKSGAKTIADIAEELEAKTDSVKKTIQRLERAGIVIQVGGTVRSKTDIVTWGLTST